MLFRSKSTKKSHIYSIHGSLDGASGKEPACQCQGYKKCKLGWEDILKEEMATHSSILAWRILQTEESGGLQSMGSQRQT